MPGRAFTVEGRVVEAQSQRAVAGVRVEAWDWDTRYHDLLGVTETDALGRFEVAFDEAYFGDYAPDRLPDVFFKVFRGDTLIKSTENVVLENLQAGSTDGIVIEVDDLRTLDGATGPPVSNEVTLHELGESIALGVASVQRELARYPNALGAFVMDEMTLEVPVRMRMDPLGQVRATVVGDDTPGETVGRLSLRMKSVLGASEPPPIVSGQPLSSLGVLSQEAIKRLENERIFSVDDLLRVARNASGQIALENMGLDTDLDAVLDRAAVLSLPMLPGPVTENLLQLGVETPDAFADRDAAELAKELAGRLNQPVSAEDVSLWQQKVGEAIALPMPRQTAQEAI